MFDYVLEMKSISKRYGGIVALDNVDFSLKKGEVLCLVGENGAGKSTLMKILTGVVKPDSGEITLKGKLVRIDKPIDAYRLGISIVHQELIQIPDMTVAENIFLGRYDTIGPFISFKSLRQKTERLMEKIGIYFDPSKKMKTFSVAQRQLIEIVKALSYDSSIIVFDEPTATLTIDETRQFYEVVEKLQKDGISIIFISHRMDDIFNIGNRVHVLRDGKTTGVKDVENLNADDIIKMMIGRNLSQQYVTKTNKPKDVILELEDVTNEKIKSISFQVKEGEVFGLGGLIGSGRTEVLKAIYGIDSYEGKIFFKGQLVKNRTPKESILSGFSFVPEDRKDEALILNESILRNISINIIDKISKCGFVNERLENSIAENFMKDLNIKAPNQNAKVYSLSGGNQQKVVISKSLASEPTVILLDEPTRGVDVGAKAEIYQIINELANKGYAILMVSSELPELISVSDRIAVMHEGKITGIVEAISSTEKSLMELAIK